jgi:3-isopropylmalate/(R)-2-methylmalate dehydratase small subunit
VPFAIDHEIRHRLLGGLDDIAMTLKQADAIDAYEAQREQRSPAVPVTTAL